MLSVLFAESGDNCSRLLEFYAPNASRVLDVTFGNGTLTKRARVRVMGIDKDPSTKPTVRADARALPFVAGSFDAAIYDPPYLYGSLAMHMGPTHEAIETFREQYSEVIGRVCVSDVHWERSDDLPSCPF